jgi:hypothetical protein
MNASDHDVVLRAGPPQGVKPQLRRLPKKMANGGKADIEPFRLGVPARGNRGP